MAKVTYVTLGERPHIGHVTWLRAIRALGHEVRLVNLRRAIFSPHIHDGILITEGVRPTMYGALYGTFFRCWIAVANSPSILKPSINTLYQLPDMVIAVSRMISMLVRNATFILYPVPPELEVLLKFKSINKEPWICFAGPFIPIKGIHLIPDIALRLKNEGIKASFILIGDTAESPLGRLITRRAKTLGVDEYIKIMGPMTRIELFKLISRCSVYLQPSLSDAFSVSVIEAMALGVVPVVTKYVGASEIIKLVDESLIKEPEPDGIAEKLKALLTEPRALRELSEQSRLIIKHMFSFDFILNRINELMKLCV
jgi:glycosyltransferase involved in cell wall biosynthesis